MSPNLPEKITAQEVPESERLNCLPRHFGRWMLHVENLIYDFMREMSPDYNGAYWRFFDLSNGGFYMSPDLNAERVRVQIENGYAGLMTADAAGITACLFALSHFSFAVKDDAITNHFHWLREYALNHPEASDIFRAID